MITGKAVRDTQSALRSAPGGKADEISTKADIGIHHIAHKPGWGVGTAQKGTIA